MVDKKQEYRDQTLAELKEYVRNPELVTSALGSWPSFHDAEILSIRLDRDRDVRAELVIQAIPYDPFGKSKGSVLTLLFKGLDELRLVDFNHQNVIWALDVKQDGERTRLDISTSFGLEGSFYFSEAEVLSVERL